MHSSEKLERNEVNRSKYFMDCSRREIEELVGYLDEIKEQVSKEANDAVQK